MRRSKAPSLDCDYINLGRFEEAKALLRKTLPVARRALGESHRITLKARLTYTDAVYKDGGATLYDLREAVATLEEIEPIAQRVLGGSHPLVVENESHLCNSRAEMRAALAAREAP